jgi:hypothetical protein
VASDSVLVQGSGDGVVVSGVGAVKCMPAGIRVQSVIGIGHNKDIIRMSCVALRGIFTYISTQYNLRA